MLWPVHTGGWGENTELVQLSRFYLIDYRFRRKLFRISQTSKYRRFRKSVLFITVHESHFRLKRWHLKLFLQTVSKKVVGYQTSPWSYNVTNWATNFPRMWLVWTGHHYAFTSWSRYTALNQSHSTRTSDHAHSRKQKSTKRDKLKSRNVTPRTEGGCSIKSERSCCCIPDEYNSRPIAFIASML